MLLCAGNAGFAALPRPQCGQIHLHQKYTPTLPLPHLHGASLLALRPDFSYEPWPSVTTLASALVKTGGGGALRVTRCLSPPAILMQCIILYRHQGMLGARRQVL